MNTVKLILSVTLLSSSLAGAVSPENPADVAFEADAQQRLISSFARGLSVSPHHISAPAEAAQAMLVTPFSLRQVHIDLVDSFNAGLGIALELEETPRVAGNVTLSTAL